LSGSHILPAKAGRYTFERSTSIQLVLTFIFQQLGGFRLQPEGCVRCSNDYVEPGDWRNNAP